MTPEEFVKCYEEAELGLTPEDEMKLANSDFRREIYSLLHVSVSARHRPLIRRLMQEEIQNTRDPMGGVGDDLCWCGYLLSCIGNPKDALLLWETKSISFDTYCGFDVQFLVGAGVDQTVAFLKQSKEPRAQDALDYILRCMRSGDFDEIEEWCSWRHGYFRG